MFGGMRPGECAFLPPECRRGGKPFLLLTCCVRKSVRVQSRLIIHRIPFYDICHALRVWIWCFANNKSIIFFFGGLRVPVGVHYRGLFIFLILISLTSSSCCSSAFSSASSFLRCCILLQQIIFFAILIPILLVLLVLLLLLFLVLLLHLILILFFFLLLLSQQSWKDTDWFSPLQISSTPAPKLKVGVLATFSAFDRLFHGNCFSGWIVAIHSRFEHFQLKRWHCKLCIVDIYFQCWLSHWWVASHTEIVPVDERQRLIAGWNKAVSSKMCRHVANAFKQFTHASTYIYIDIHTWICTCTNRYKPVTQKSVQSHTGSF